MITLRQAAKELGRNKETVKGVALGLGLPMETTTAAILLRREDLPKIRAALKPKQKRKAKP